MSELSRLRELQEENCRLREQLEEYRKDDFYLWLHQAFQDHVLHTPGELQRWTNIAAEILHSTGGGESFDYDMAEALLAEELEDEILSKIPCLSETPPINAFFQALLHKAVSRLGVHHVSQIIMDALISGGDGDRM